MTTSDQSNKALQITRRLGSGVASTVMPRLKRLWV